jgi:hypothetical protein
LRRKYLPPLGAITGSEQMQQNPLLDRVLGEYEQRSGNSKSGQ